MQGYNSESWIEGIGSLSGLLHNYDGRVGGDAFILSCVTHNSKLLFDKYETGECVRIALGLEHFSQSPIKIYPNPFSKEIYIFGLPDDRVLNFQVFNSLGQEVLNGELSETNSSVSVPGPAGIYILLLKDNKGRALKEDIIIKK